MTNPFRFIPNIALAFALACWAAPSHGAAPVDIRILVDVSGSMKTNDPNNLRIPAIRLVAELMPRGATAGVWLFSESVEALIAPVPVDDAWKRNASSVAAKIHSRGQFTDIEAALVAASRDWREAGPGKADRHLILLTDGVVDVSKNTQESSASRDRIVTRHIGTLKTLGVNVHTIALSPTSDREMLTVLAEQTEGWAEQVDDAESLQRVFLHMFEQAARPDTLPLLDDRFEVDASISEMTLLVFRDSDDDPLQLRDPSSGTLTRDAHPESVRWRQDAGYDLVTVSGPAPGTWQINTSPDPDNRVMIVTDLKLQVQELPAGLMADEVVDVRARITERGAHLQRDDFLRLVNARLAVATTGSKGANAESMTYDPAGFEFHQQRKADWPPGDYEFVVRVDGGTFQREQRARVRIYGAPLTFASRLGEDARSIAVTIDAEPDLVDLDSLGGIVVVRGPDGDSDVIDLPVFDRPTTNLVVPAARNGTYRVEPRVFGYGVTGRRMDFRTPPLVAVIVDGDDAPATAPVATAVAPPEIDWLRGSAIVAGGNAVVFTLVAFVWFVLGRRQRTGSSEVVLQ